MRKPWKRTPNVFSFREPQGDSVAATKEMKDSEAEVSEVRGRNVLQGLASEFKALHLLACSAQPQSGFSRRVTVSESLWPRPLDRDHLTGRKGQGRRKVIGII